MGKGGSYVSHFACYLSLVFSTGVQCRQHSWEASRITVRTYLGYPSLSACVVLFKNNMKFGAFKDRPLIC